MSAHPSPKQEDMHRPSPSGRADHHDPRVSGDHALPSRVGAKILQRLRDNGPAWLALHLAQRGAQRASDLAMARITKLERDHDLPGLNSISYNRLKWDAYDWSAGGEEWSGPDGWKEAVVHQFLDPWLPPAARADVLEIGPGAGRWTSTLANRSRRLWLADVSQQALRLSEERLKSASSDVNFLLTGGDNLDGVPSSSIDVVWSFDVFVHMAPVDQKSYLREIARVLRSGGRAILHHGGAYGRHGGWRSATTADSFADAVRAAGLEVLNQVSAWGDGTYVLPVAGDVVTTIAKL